MALRRILATLAALAAAAAGGGCGSDGDSGGEGGERPRPGLVGGIWIVGDGGLEEPEDDLVAAMIERHDPNWFLFLGDVYENGTAEEYRENYAPSYGRFKFRTYPIPGDHEWPNREEGYDRYWTELMSRNDGRHYYAFHIAGWTFLALNSEESLQPGSAQFRWLRRELRALRDDCAMAMVHAPRFNAGRHGDTEELAPAWDELAGDVVAVFSGDDHNYQRMRPEDGTTQFIVGTGGRMPYEVDTSDPRLAASEEESLGALRLELAKGRAEYDFVTIDGRVLDSGSLSCDPSN